MLLAGAIGTGNAKRKKQVPSSCSCFPSVCPAVFPGRHIRKPLWSSEPASASHNMASKAHVALRGSSLANRKTNINEGMLKLPELEDTVERVREVSLLEERHCLKPEGLLGAGEMVQQGRTLGCTSRGPGFKPQHQLSVTPASGELMPSACPLLASTDTVCIGCTHIQSRQNTHTHRIKQKPEGPPAVGPEQTGVSPGVIRQLSKWLTRGCPFQERWTVAGSCRSQAVSGT